MQANTVVPIKPVILPSVLPPTKKELRQAIANGANLGWKRSLSTVISELSRPLPDDYLSAKTLKGEKIIYVDVHTLSWILDYVAPGWQVEFRESQISDRAVVTARLTLLCEEGSFTRESFGSDSTDDQYFGGFMADSESQAFRRASSRFGLCRYLYEKSVINMLKKRF
jgi:hypothetical protein